MNTCNCIDFIYMFTEILEKYMQIKGVSQTELAILTGDTPQAISDFIKNSRNPRATTRDKFFNALQGFKKYYNELFINTYKLMM